MYNEWRFVAPLQKCSQIFFSVEREQNSFFLIISALHLYYKRQNATVRTSICLWHSKLLYFSPICIYKGSVYVCLFVTSSLRTGYLKEKIDYTINFVRVQGRISDLLEVRNGRHVLLIAKKTTYLNGFYPKPLWITIHYS